MSTVRKYIETIFNKIDELENQKQKFRNELMDTIATLDKTDFDQETIDWYYWESGLSATILENILGIGPSKLRNRVTPLTDLRLTCPMCEHADVIHEATSRNGLTQVLAEYKKAKRNLNKQKLHYPGISSKDLSFCCLECRIKTDSKINERREGARKGKRKPISAKHNYSSISLEELLTMPYGDYLNTDHWRLFAAKARKRAGYECEECHSKNVLLHVHHLTYERRGQELYTDVKVLCKRCHEKAHGIEER